MAKRYNEKTFTFAVPSRHRTARCADALFSSENIRANSLNNSNCEGWKKGERKRSR